MSSDPNRPRPRSSKKRRAVQTGGRSAAAQRGAAGRRGTGGPAGGGPTSRISNTQLALIAVVVFAIGVALAGGVIKFGSASPSSAISGTVSFVPGASGGSAASGGARGTNCPTAQPPAATAGQTRVVTIETAKGQIQITLKADLSPIAVGNFAALAACGYYDGIVFHRVAKLADGTPFVIQGGDPDGTGRGGPGYTIQDEPVTTPYLRGTVAMARTGQPNSVGSQFFIVLDDKDQPILADANTYQIIGSVTSGMDTVDAIYADAHGQESPANPIAMTKVTIGPAAATSPGASGPGGSSPPTTSPPSPSPS